MGKHLMIFLFKTVGIGGGENVATLVVRMSVVPLDPDKLDLMTGKQGEQLFPKIRVKSRLFIRFYHWLLGM